MPLSFRLHVWGLILLATIQSLLYIALSAVWRTCGLYHLETHTHSQTDSRLSGLAAKQLSVIVASGASSVEAQKVNGGLDFFFFFFPMCPVDVWSSVRMITLSQN